VRRPVARPPHPPARPEPAQRPGHRSRHHGRPAAWRAGTGAVATRAHLAGRLTSVPTLPSIPATLGRYKVVRAIARGGMSEVYEVEEPSSGERLALKLLTYPGPVLPRFNREYEAMTRLNHVGIVRVFEYGFHDDKPWISMELLDGVPLQKAAKDVGR